jgi:hypothetical protein
MYKRLRKFFPGAMRYQILRLGFILKAKRGVVADKMQKEEDSRQLAEIRQQIADSIHSKTDNRGTDK